MKWVFWILNFPESVLWSNHVGNPNYPGQIYTVSQCVKRMGTIVLNNVFVLTQYLLIIFWSNQDAKLDMNIQVQIEYK